MAFISSSEASVASHFELQITQFWEYDQITFNFVFFSIFPDLDMTFDLLWNPSVESNCEQEISQNWEYDQNNFKFVIFSVFPEVDMVFILLLEASVESNLELQITHYWRIEASSVDVWGSIQDHLPFFCFVIGVRCTDEPNLPLDSSGSSSLLWSSPTLLANPADLLLHSTRHPQRGPLPRSVPQKSAGFAKKSVISTKRRKARWKAEGSVSSVIEPLSHKKKSKWSYI